MIMNDNKKGIVHNPWTGQGDCREFPAKPLEEIWQKMDDQANATQGIPILPTVEEMMEILENAKDLTPEQHFNLMVDCGTIDKNGYVMPNKGFVTREENERRRRCGERYVAENVLRLLQELS